MELVFKVRGENDVLDRKFLIQQIWVMLSYAHFDGVLDHVLIFFKHISRDRDTGEYFTRRN